MSFFKPKASKSINTNDALVTGNAAPAVAAGNSAVGNLSALLTGQGDTAGAQTNYDNYLQNAGYSNALTQGERGITGQGAASGLLQSGATAKALTSFGGQLDQQYFNNYLQNLSGVAGLGQNANSQIANVGQQQTGATPSLFSSITSAIGQLGQGASQGAAAFGG